jgi:hypothetical protein
MSLARQWFLSKYKNDKNKIYTSKFYTPEESWPKTHVWWLQIPTAAIDTQRYEYVNLLCQVGPGKNEYYYLKVPTSFMNEHLKKFDFIGDKISLYLSANPNTLFVEERGEGKLKFNNFLIEKN